MFKLLRDLFQGLACPACGKRGLVHVQLRGIPNVLDADAMINPGISLARCDRCTTRWIKPVGENTYRRATDEEWREHAVEELPPARVR